MTAVEIDGYYYVGYLSIPGLEINLPIMESWDYKRLNIAPCRYSGSSKTDDLVLAGHNYRKHFSPLKNIKAGEEVFFTDMDGITYKYTVMESQVLEPVTIEDMITGDWDLTLFTCTYGGRARLAVRCTREE